MNKKKIALIATLLVVPGGWMVLATWAGKKPMKKLLNHFHKSKSDKE